MRKFFLENIGLKLTAVLLSIILWMFATSRGQSEISIDAPIQFKNIPSGFELTNQDIKTISMNIRGQERLIKNIRPPDISVYVDLSNAKKGESVYYIDRDDIKLPPAITITNISPPSIKVSIEETIRKIVKVRPVIIGTPETGYYVKSIETMPQTVVIEGIRSEVERVNKLKTESLDITGINETLTQDLKLDLKGINIRTKTNDVEVKVVIGAERK
ncbi:MAG: CdaR family protein [Nitrospirota bacterium]